MLGNCSIIRFSTLRIFHESGITTEEWGGGLLVVSWDGASFFNLLVKIHYSVLLVLKKETGKYISRLRTFITTYDELLRQSRNFYSIA